MTRGSTIVVDIGKTHGRVSLWSDDGVCLEKASRTNAAQAAYTAARPYASLDVEGTTEWLFDALAGFASHRVEAIIPVTHGAAVAGIRDGALSFAPPDYEWEIPQHPLDEYRDQRDPFSATGSPALPGGLNIGSQLHYLDDLGLLDGVTLMPYAQYWAWLLSGNAVSEVTSLGCHSDLWVPQEADFSPLAKRRGWAVQFAPLAEAADCIGTLRPEIADRTGLSPDVRIHAGLHDSNAALMAARGFPEIADNEATALSTGTWFIAMRLAKQKFDLAALPEARDCLINVDAFGQPVPSSRFMGGRELELLTEIDANRIDIRPDQPSLVAAVPDVLELDAMVLPTLAPGCGPYPDSLHAWCNRPDDVFARRAAASLYAALMADASLDLIGSRERLLIEGRFAEAQVFVRALAGLRPDTQVFTADAENDVSFGALRLIRPELEPQGTLAAVVPLDHDLTEYKASWRELSGDITLGGAATA